jgi:hypothetical protein
MLRIVLLTTLLSLQLRPPEALRPAATPPPEGSGRFREYSYTFYRESLYYVIDFTPMLPGKRAIVLDAMKSVCRDLYDLDFTKAQPHPGPGSDVWSFELKDLRTCYGRQMPSSAKRGKVPSFRIWMPAS